MSCLNLETNPWLQQVLQSPIGDNSCDMLPLEDKVKALILRDLLFLNWKADFRTDKVTLTPPSTYDKEIVRASMSIKRREKIHRHALWLDAHSNFASENLASGEQALGSSLHPVVEVCKTRKQFEIFRFFRFYWSSPYSDYVGRRIKLLIRDAGLPNLPLIGIAALGSSIVHIPERDEWVGWDKAKRTENLVYAMDAFVLGALPPYTHLLGGKLISYILASNEIRYLYETKYRNKLTNISKRKANRLACIFTTSLYGKSSQYNRIKFRERLLYQRIGRTKGYGTLHLRDDTFDAMRQLMISHNLSVTNRFGDGPAWRMRLIRTACEYLNIDQRLLLKHSFQRDIYAVPLAFNTLEFLRGEHKHLRYYNYKMSELVAYWRNRWLAPRKTRGEVVEKTLDFKPAQFTIS